MRGLCGHNHLCTAFADSTKCWGNRGLQLCVWCHPNTNQRLWPLLTLAKLCRDLHHNVCAFISSSARVWTFSWCSIPRLWAHWLKSIEHLKASISLNGRALTSTAWHLHPPASGIDWNSVLGLWSLLLWLRDSHVSAWTRIWWATPWLRGFWPLPITTGPACQPLAWSWPWPAGWLPSFSLDLPHQHHASSQSGLWLWLARPLSCPHCLSIPQGAVVLATPWQRGYSWSGDIFWCFARSSAGFQLFWPYISICAQEGVSQ